MAGYSLWLTSMHQLEEVCQRQLICKLRWVADPQLSAIPAEHMA